MTKEHLEALETDVKAELLNLAKQQQIVHDPITDGVVDIDCYLAASPKILWILKEPWETLKDGEAGGGWSVTKDLLGAGRVDNKGTYAPMAYVTYSIFNGFPKWNDISYVTKDPRVADSLKNIAYINVKKFPGKTTSNTAEIEKYYEKFRPLLLHQIQVINPDIIIGGRVLPLFLNDFGLCHTDFASGGHASYCVRNQKLYISAYHPGQWSAVRKDVYVDEIVSIIKNHSPVLPPQSPIINRKS